MKDRERQENLDKNLLKATRSESYELVSLFLNSGANPLYQEENFGPLDIARQDENQDIIDLLEGQLDLNSRLMRAVTNNDAYLVDHLLANGANPSFVDPQTGRSAIQQAQYLENSALQDLINDVFGDDSDSEYQPCLAASATNSTNENQAPSLFEEVNSAISFLGSAFNLIS